MPNAACSTGHISTSVCTNVEQEGKHINLLNLAAMCMHASAKDTGKH